MTILYTDTTCASCGDYSGGDLACRRCATSADDERRDRLARLFAAQRDVLTSVADPGLRARGLNGLDAIEREAMR
jgi:hypothetical protein